MFEWLKRRKKPKMTDDQIISVIRDEMSQVPKFQWVKTHRAGEISMFRDVTVVDGSPYIEFQDGSRIKHDMVGDVVMKVADDSMLLDIGPGGMDPTISSVDEDIYAPIPGQPNAPLRPGQQPNVNIGMPQPKPESPIHSLLKKQKAEPVPIEISVNLKLPPVELYKVLSSSFDNADEEIVEFVVADLDVPMIKQAVKDAITQFYTNG